MFIIFENQNTPQWNSFSPFATTCLIPVLHTVPEQAEMSAWGPTGCSRDGPSADFVPRHRKAYTTGTVAYWDLNVLLLS